MVLARLLRAPSPHTQRILVFNFSLLANQKFQNRYGNITQEIPAQGKLSPVPVKPVMKLLMDHPVICGHSWVI